jgi:hypothetical protein
MVAELFMISQFFIFKKKEKLNVQAQYLGQVIIVPEMFIEI